MMLQKKLSEMDPNEIQITNNILFRTENRLLDIYAGVTDRALKALFLINGGGVVTLIAYMHDSSVVNIKLIASLAAFLLGLLLTVMVVAVDYYVCLESLRNFAANLQRFNNDKIKLDEAQHYTTRSLSVVTKTTVYLGYAAALLFLTGCSLGVAGYFNVVKNII
jgi:hypothetical protein